MFVRRYSGLSGLDRFVLTEQWVTILPCSTLSAKCREICCDSGCDVENKEGLENGLWIRIDGQHRGAHTPFDRNVTRRGVPFHKLAGGGRREVAQASKSGACGAGRRAADRTWPS